VRSRACKKSTRDVFRFGSSRFGIHSLGDMSQVNIRGMKNKKTWGSAALLCPFALPVDGGLQMVIIFTLLPISGLWLGLIPTLLYLIANFVSTAISPFSRDDRASVLASLLDGCRLMMAVLPQANKKTAALHSSQNTLAKIISNGYRYSINSCPR
jgi:hypothetical protein